MAEQEPRIIVPPFEQPHYSYDPDQVTLSDQEAEKIQKRLNDMAVQNVVDRTLAQLKQEGKEIQ